MHQYRIAVCDDNYHFRNELLALLSEFENESDNSFEIHSYSSGTELLDETDKLFHIILLDVELGELSGIDVARYIRKKDTQVQIIFITGHDSYAYNAYELDAIGYLLKPISKEPFKKILTKAIITIEYINDKLLTQQRFIEVKIKNDTTRIDMEHILYIEKHRNTVMIHTKFSTYTVYDTLSNIYKRLDINKFIYIHQGYIVNFNKIFEINNTFIVIEGFIKLPISRKYYKSTKERFFNDMYNE